MIKKSFKKLVSGIAALSIGGFVGNKSTSADNTPISIDQDNEESDTPSENEITTNTKSLNEKVGAHPLAAFFATFSGVGLVGNVMLLFRYGRALSKVDGNEKTWLEVATKVTGLANKEDAKKQFGNDWLDGKTVDWNDEPKTDWGPFRGGTQNFHDYLSTRCKQLTLGAGIHTTLGTISLIVLNS